MYYNTYPPFPPQSEREIRLQQQKAAVNSTANLWGFTGTIANIVISVIAVVLSFVLVRYTYLDKFVQSPTGQLVMQIILSVLMFTVPYIIAARTAKMRVSSLVSVKHVRGGLFFPLVFISLGASVIINQLTENFVRFLNMFGINPQSADFEIPSDAFGILLYIFTISVVPAVVEEFAMRGIVMGSLRRYGNAFAVIASSIIFGLMHGNFVQIPFAFALGCVLGYIDIVTDSIWPSVTVHFINNLMSAVQQVIIEKQGESAGIASVAIFFSISLALGLVGFFMLCRRFKHPFAPMEETVDIPLGTALKSFCSSAGMIVAYIIFGGSAVAMLFLY